jgi:hypothetical protein
MIRLLFFCLAGLSLAGCASGSNANAYASMSEHLADMPHWMGGLPADAPPRRGTRAYDAWMAERAKEAARPKNLDPKNLDAKNLDTKGGDAKGSKKDVAR